MIWMVFNKSNRIHIVQFIALLTVLTCCFFLVQSGISRLSPNIPPILSLVIDHKCHVFVLMKRENSCSGICYGRFSSAEYRNDRWSSIASLSIGKMHNFADTDALHERGRILTLSVSQGGAVVFNKKNNGGLIRF